MNKKMPRTPFSTPLSGSARETELRIRSIMSGPKKRPPLPFLVLVFFICIFCGNIVSCQVKEEEPEQEPPGISQPDSSQQLPDTSGGMEQNTPKVPNPAAPPAIDPDSAARAAYAKVLEDLLFHRNLPDGQNGEAIFDDMSENEFALADVDGDGREELVLLTRPVIYAGYWGYILDYDQDTGAVRIQFDGFPSLTFYTNGALAEDDSHAQGIWTDDFWPHSLYRYLPETDSYELAGHVSAWEKSVSDINEGHLPPFPTEKDKSGAGILYYIHPVSSYEYLNNIEERIDMAVDQSVYLEWLAPIIGDAQPLELEYLPLTEENISRIK